VAILDFEIIEEPSFTKSLLTYIQLMNRETFEVIYNNLLYVFLSIKKFTKTEDQLETFIDKWLYLLRNMNRIDKYPDNIKDKILMKFLNQAEIAQLDDRERSIYEQSLKIYRDELLVERSREREKREYLAGMEALAATQEELANLKQQFSQIAQNARKQGMSIEAIAQLTGISKEKVIELL